MKMRERISMRVDQAEEWIFAKAEKVLAAYRRIRFAWICLFLILVAVLIAAFN